MAKPFFIAIFILGAAFICGIFLRNTRHISKDNLAEPFGLRTEIAKSIKVPFQNGDTMIYNPVSDVDCGNISQAERDRTYNPYLVDSPYIEILRKNYNGAIQILDKSTGNRFNTNPNSFNTKDKIVFTISGNVDTNKAVEIIETYSRNNEETYRIVKRFSFENGRWINNVVEVKFSHEIKNGQRN